MRPRTRFAVVALCTPALASAQGSPDPIASGTAGGIILFGFIVFLAGMAGIVFPRLLRLPRRLYSVPIALAGFVLFTIGANIQDEADRERERAERSARQAAEREELRQRREAYEARRAAIPPPAPQWTLNTHSDGYRSAVKPGDSGQLFLSINCQDLDSDVAVTRQAFDRSNLLTDSDVEITWDDGTADQYSDAQRLIAKLRRLNAVTFTVDDVSDTVDLSGAAAVFDSLD